MGWRTAPPLPAGLALAVTLTFCAVTAPAPVVTAEQIENDNATAPGSTTLDVIFEPDLIVLPDDDPEFCTQYAQLCPGFGGN